MQRDALVAYLDDYLHIREFDDYGPQGLQVEGADQVHKITVSVDAALTVIEAAVQAGSNFHLAHHGLFWGDPQRLVGPLGRRVRALFQSNVSLYAVHLALDAHPEVGNNAVLARLLEVEITDWWAPAKGNPIGVLGTAPAGLSLDELVGRLAGQLGVQPLVYDYGPKQIGRVGIISGGAADEIAAAAGLGLDTYITGETSHSHYWDAAEHRINVIFAGHYATETVGVKALAAHLAQTFDLQTEFLSFPTSL